MSEGGVGFALSRKGNYVAACGFHDRPDLAETGEAVVWKLPEGSVFATYHSVDGFMYTLAISPDERTLAIGLGGNRAGSSVKFYDMLTGREKSVIRGSISGSGLAFSPDGKVLATAQGLFDANRGERICDFRGNSFGLFSPDGRMALLPDGLFDITAKRLSVKFVDDGSRSPSFSPTGDILASVLQTVKGLQGVRLRDTRTGLSLAKGPAFNGSNQKTSAVAFSPDGSLLVTGNVDGTLVVWDYATERQIATLEGHSKGVWSVLFTSDGMTIASTTLIGEVIVWDVEYPAIEQP
jgi:WD40 repeat protein